MGRTRQILRQLLTGIVLIGISVAVPPALAAVLSSTGFESPTSSMGAIAGQHGLDDNSIASSTAETGVLYGAQGGTGDTLVRIDPLTGVATVIGKAGWGFPGLAVSPTGELYGIPRATQAFFRLDAKTGQAFQIGTTGVAWIESLAFDRDGNLWGCTSFGLQALYRLDPSTGTATHVGTFNEAIVGLAVDPNDGTVYASSGGSGATVPDGIYTVETTTGALTLIGTTGLGGATTDLAFDAAGRLYGVKGSGGGGGGTPGLSTLISIDKTTGTGTPIGPTGITGISGLTSQAFLNRAGQGVIYGTQGNQGDQLVSVHPGTAAGTVIGNTGHSFPGLAVSPTGDLYATTLDPSGLYRVDATTGQSFLVGLTGISYMEALAFDHFGQLWGWGFGQGLFRINASTGNASPVGTSNLSLVGLAFEPGSGTLYASAGATDDQIYTINTTTGAPTLLGTTEMPRGTPDLAFSATGRLLGVTGGGQGGVPSDLIDIDKATGAATVVGSTGIIGISGLGSRIGATSDVPSLGGLLVGASLDEARPNPFGLRTQLRFVLERRSPVEIDVFSVAGQRVRRLVDGTLESGEHFVSWNGRDDLGRSVGDGVYYVRLRAGGASFVRKTVLLR